MKYFSIRYWNLKKQVTGIAYIFRITNFKTNEMEIKFVNKILLRSCRSTNKFKSVTNIGSGEGYNKELHSLYHSPNIVRVIKSRRLRWARMEEGRSAFNILTGKPTGKRPLGKPRRKWEDNIGMDLGINVGN